MSVSRETDRTSVADLRKRLLLALVAVVFLVFIYANIYRWAVLTFTAQEHSLLKSTQVVIEALTTAGFGGDTDLWREHDELAALVILMNLTGVLLVFLALPLFAVPLFREAMDTAPPTESTLRDHIVICGHSAMDDVLREELDDAGIQHLFIESDIDEVEALNDEGLNAIYGNAERVDTLRKANVEHARAVVADLDDETNPTVILSADRVNPDATIISVVRDRDAISHHKYAGADEVVVSKQELGESLAMRSIKTVSERFQEAVGDSADIEFDEYLVTEGSELIGRTIRDIDLFDELELTIIGGWFGARFRISPSPDTEIVPNTILLVSGDGSELEAVGARQLPSHKGHPSRVIISGYGDVGKAAARTARAQGIKVTVVDSQSHAGVDVVGDVTEEETLEAANIDNARSVVLAIDDDATAIYSVIMMKQLAPDVEIIARANDPENVWKLYNAGADYVLSLPAISGEILASLLIGEETILTPRDEFEFTRTEAPALVGESLREADIRNRTNCTVVAIERDGELLTDFGPTITIEDGDVLIGAGTAGAIGQFRELAASAPVEAEISNSSSPTDD